MVKLKPLWLRLHHPRFFDYFVAKLNLLGLRLNRPGYAQSGCVIIKIDNCDGLILNENTATHVAPGVLEMHKPIATQPEWVS